MGCRVCGASAPTKNVAFSQTVGALFTRFSSTVSGELCRRCIGRSFWRMTLVTLLFGWWSLGSFFRALLIVPSNVLAYAGAFTLPRRYPEAKPPAKNPTAKEAPAAPPPAPP